MSIYPYKIYELTKDYSYDCVTGGGSLNIEVFETSSGFFCRAKLKSKPASFVDIPCSKENNILLDGAGSIRYETADSALYACFTFLLIYRYQMPVQMTLDVDRLYTITQFLSNGSVLTL